MVGMTLDVSKRRVCHREAKDSDEQTNVGEPPLAGLSVNQTRLVACFLSTKDSIWSSRSFSLSTRIAAAVDSQRSRVKFAVEPIIKI
jgi:hypothetical protein